jgi:lysophospholipase L1-like esterase
MPAPDPTTPTISGPISYLALGDSYTIGQGVASPAERWPNQLGVLARAQGIDVRSPDIIAQTGWTTTNLLDAIAASGNTRTDYGLVTLLIGVNDQYDGQSIDVFRSEFKRLLGKATVFAGGRAGRVVVLSIPDWGQAPFASGQNRPLIAQQIDQFNAVALEECQRMGIVFVNITPLTRNAGADPTQFVADGLHYTGASMAPWAQRALGAVKQLR